MRVLLTGADGKLASVVRPFLRSEGFAVYNWGRGIDLVNDRAVTDAVKRMPASVDALVHLAGAYIPGNTPLAYERNRAANYQSFVTTAHTLIRESRFTPYPTIIGIGASFSATPEDMERDSAYHYSKTALRNIINSINGRQRYAVCIEPAGPLDTDEKRDDIALRIVDAINAPVFSHTQEDAYVASLEVPR
jgi:nucleoside-diphosphate-sugar epimerase